MGRPTQDGCKRPGWDDPARLTAVGKAEPLRGGLASESRISEGLPRDPSSGAVDPTPPTRAFEPADAAPPRARGPTGGQSSPASRSSRSWAGAAWGSFTRPARST